MYDQDTIDQILLGPKVDEEFDLEIVPKMLTDAFARTVSTRLNLLDASSDEKLFQSLEYLNRISAAYEAYATLFPDQENRTSAAFIAASAYQAISEAPRYRPKGSYIDISTVSPDVCAALLFLLAEAHADANDAAKTITTSPKMDVMEVALLECIKNLAIGNIIEIADFDIPDFQSHTEDSERLAFNALLYLLTCGIKSLAKLILGDDKDITEKKMLSAKDMFLRVKKLSSYIDDDEIFEGSRLLNIYGGPLHLANLLLGIEKKVHQISLGMIECPDVVNRKSWKKVIRKMAIQRPYLWKNHRDAIEKGYLTPGVSSAISFPTGAGKSTLTELKIAVSLLLGKRVVFLAPTNALVEQTKRSLYKTFSDVIAYFDNDDRVISDDTVKLGKVTVMTPERCMMSVSIDKEAFIDVGLIVLDECHILHSNKENYSHRGLDSMLVMLNLTGISPNADLLLLSAMMKNTDDIAGWIEDLTGRRCLSLKLSWKPTRQVRGCVVYPASRISELNTILAQQSSINPTGKRLPAPTQRKLTCQPFGLMSLHQTWKTKQRADYALLPLLSGECTLATGKGGSRGGWYLTPNANEVSRNISKASSKAGMKTLVFVQTIVSCESNIKNFLPNESKEKVVLTEDEERLLNIAAQEMGGRDYCYLEVDDENTLKSGAVSHHGLLLPEERNLHESLFNRKDGVDIVFATSTLAQGMNLPSQVVIICGDDRFDRKTNKKQKLQAHELLNAAGRAGRAGQNSQGVVLLIPSKVIGYDDSTGSISRHWMDMKAIFEQSDQCLEIGDPLKVLLDRVQDLISSDGVVEDQTCLYFLRKIKFITVGDEENSTRANLSRSFCAFSARRNNETEWLNSRINTVIRARKKMNEDGLDNWNEEISSTTGFSPEVISRISKLIKDENFGITSEGSVDALLTWLDEDPLLIYKVLNIETIENMFGDWYKKSNNSQEKAEYAIRMFREVLPVWMSGAPLCEVEVAHTMRSKTKKCRSARHFSLRVASDFGFLASIPGRILLEKKKSDPESHDVPIVVATLGNVVREGCDSPEALATRMFFGRSVSRVAARAFHTLIQPLIATGSPTESFDDTRTRIDEAVMKFASQ